MSPKKALPPHAPSRPRGPLRWLRRELLEGRLPTLPASPRLLVNVSALREALERRAGEENYRGQRVN
jgi:hypothetical protein